jgi:hypothetical protein
MITNFEFPGRAFVGSGLLIFLLVLGPGLAGAQEIVMNPHHAFPVDWVFTVELTIDCAGRDVKGVETRLTFDPAILQLDDVTPGSWFTGSGLDFFFYDYTDNEPQGNIHIASSVLEGTLNTDDVFAVLHFTGVGIGTSPVDFTEVDVRDATNGILVFGHSIGDLITLDPAVEIQPYRFGQLKAVYR